MWPLFTFSLRQALFQRQVLFQVLLLAAPCALAGHMRHFAAGRQGVRLWMAYHEPMQLLFGLILPLLAMLAGAALLGPEIESRTVLYLITRRLGRRRVWLVRFAALAVAVTLLSEAAAALLFSIVFGASDLPEFSTRYQWTPLAEWGRYALLIPVTVIVYLAVFSLISLVVARPIALSILYLILVELAVARLPFPARAYTITHQIQALMTRHIDRVHRLVNLSDQLKAQLLSETWPAWTIIGIIIAVCVITSCVLVARRELVPAKLARD